MHGKFPNYLSSDHINTSQSFLWLKHTGLKSMTEELIIGAWYQALNTRYYCKHIMKQSSTDKCRMCHSQPETVEHIIAGWQTLAADKYFHRHNMVAAQLHLDIFRQYNIYVSEKHYVNKARNSNGE